MTTERDIYRRRRPLLGAMVAVAVCAALLGPLAAAGPAHAQVTFDQKMLELVNKHRADAGLNPVQADLVLNLVAGPGPYLGCGLPLAGRANDMGGRNYFSHTILGCGTQSVFNILSSTVGLVYSAAAENIAWLNGTTDPNIAAQNLMSNLMNSPGHRANILNPKFTHVGIGSWNSSPGQTWSGIGTPLANVWITAQVFAQMPLSTSPAVSLAPTSLGFGDRAVGTASPTHTVTVSNPGSAPLSISSTSVTGANAADFRIVSNTCGSTVASGASCAVAVGFTPGAAGARTATLSISDNAAGSPHTVALSGTGTAALTAAPVNVVATGGDGQLSVMWAKAPSGPSTVGYGVFVYDGDAYTGKSTWVCATCTSGVIAGLPNGKQYHADVYSHNGVTWGGAGTSNKAWVLGALGAPTGTRGEPGDGSLTVSWRPPSAAGTAIDGYGIWVYGAEGYTGKTAWQCATCTTATIPGLSNGVSYYAVVVAHNANGWGAMAFSEWVAVGTPGLPGHVVATSASGSVSATWSPAPDSGSPIVGYGLFVYDAAGYTGQSLWVCATCTSGRISGLTNGRQYTVRVYGYNAYGWGVPAVSNPVTPTS